MQNIYNKDYVYILDNSPYKFKENYFYKYNVKTNKFEKIETTYNIVSANYIGNTELFAYIDENKNVGIFDYTNNEYYENIFSFENYPNGTNISMVDFNNYIVSNDNKNLIAINKNTLEKEVITADKFDYALLGESKPEDVFLVFPNIVCVYDNKILFHTYGLDEKYSKSLFYLDEDLNVGYFCEIADMDLQFNNFETFMLKEKEVLINFYPNYEPNVDKDYYSVMYIVDLENKSYKLVDKQYINKQFLYNLIYLDYDENILYLKESDINSVDNRPQHIDDNGMVSKATDDYNESILIIDLNTYELLNKIKLHNDDSRFLNDRVFLKVD